MEKMKIILTRICRTASFEIREANLCTHPWPIKRCCVLLWLMLTNTSLLSLEVAQYSFGDYSGGPLVTLCFRYPVRELSSEKLLIAKVEQGFDSAGATTRNIF